MLLLKIDEFASDLVTTLRPYYRYSRRLCPVNSDLLRQVTEVPKHDDETFRNSSCASAPLKCLWLASTNHFSAKRKCGHDIKRSRPAISTSAFATRTTALLLGGRVNTSKTAMR